MSKLALKKTFSFADKEYCLNYQAVNPNDSQNRALNCIENLSRTKGIDAKPVTFN